MKSTTILLLVLSLSWLSESKHNHHRGKSYIYYEEKELHRTKRHIDLEPKKFARRIEVSPIKHTERNKRSLYRPYVQGQVQDVRIQIKLKTYWKDQLANKYTPQFRLLAGNVIDEISNALIDNRNFVEAAVLKFRPSKWNILVDLSLKFFKTEVDPLHYLEGIVASGWVSGLQVFSNYFKVIKIINGNVNFPVWNYPKGLRLRLHPAILTKVKPKQTKQKVILPANYKEIKISYQLYQRWNVFFLVKFSAPYRLLSGNIEESLDHAFSTSPNYLDSQVLGFRESPEGQCIVDMIVRFSSEEVYPAQKLKILVSSGNIGSIPVISDSLEIYEINNITSDQPIQEPISQEEFPKPHSDADVNQGNDTETEKGKGNPADIKNTSAQQQETKKPVYPLANKQATNVTEAGSNATSKAPSDYASMYLKLQRIRLLKQSNVMVIAHQSMKTPKTSKENVLEETSQPIYPKQSKIDSNGIVISEQQQKEFQPQTQQQKTNNYQAQQQQPKPPQYLQAQQIQQQQLSQYQGGEKQILRYQQQQQQQNALQYPQQQPIPYQQQKIPQQEQQQLHSQQQFSSLSNDAAQHDRELWQSLPEQVEGKLVMNSQKPVLQVMQQKETPKGNEKQLAQPAAKTETDYELEKLQQQIKNQNENRVTNNVETGTQGQEDSLADSSDTPTLTKPLYPQIAYSNNQLKGYNSYNATETTSKSDPKIQNNILQVAENVLTENQSNGTNAANTSTTELEASTQNENRNGVLTLIAGVLKEKVKHIKAVQMQTTYRYPIINSNMSANYLENEANKDENPKQEQGESGTEGPQQSSNTYIQKQSNSSHPQNTSNSNSFSAQQASTGTLPYSIYKEETPANNTRGNETQLSVASQKAKPQSSIGSALWNVSAAQPFNQQPVQSNAVNAYWDTQKTMNPQQASTQQKQQQQQQQLGITQQQQPLITYPQQTQQQQPVTQQQPQQNMNAGQKQQQQQNTQQPTSYQQQQQQQNMQQPTTYQQQQSNTYQQPQQQQQQQQNTQQPTTYQQQQQQNIQQPATYQQQQQQKTQQPFTYQQQKQVSTPSSEGKLAQTITPTYDTSPATGYQTKQEPQFAVPSSSSKAEAVSSPYPFYTNVRNGTVGNKEKNIFSSSDYIAQTNAPPLTSLTSITSAANQIISQSSTKENKTSVMEYYNPKEQSPNRAEPISYTVTTQSPPQDETKPKVDGVPMTPHIYTPKIKIYQWPPAISTSESPPPQNNTFEPVVSSEKEVSSHAIYHSLHGVMTLQQTWYPLLSNNGSVPFKVLAQHIEHSVEETYLAHHMRVTCKVKGLRKSHRNTSSDTAPDKVGVDFDLTFQSNEIEVVQTLKQVSKNGVISELLVFPDSVSVENASAPNTVAPSNSKQANQTTSSSSEQTLVATSPVPLGNTAEVKPENNTKAVNYSTAFQSTVSPMMSTKPPSPSFEFVTAPKDMPKSCEEIRDFGVGKADGQYVLEARKGCHLSVICQNMEDTHPKEFLGGPNRQQWEAYPFAALIKISAHDKENIQSGACLENSDEGRKLLEEIFKAKGKQKAPTPPWKTNIKKLLEGRKRREIRNKFIVISEKDAGRKSPNRFSRSSGTEGADWGVL